MNKSYIECSSLCKVYHSKGHEIKAVTNINISIDKGQFVIVRGRSGAGKSTLLNLIGGLIKPTSGNVRIGETIINELGNSALSKLLSEQVGVIFQSFNLLPAYSIYENIEIALAPARDGFSKSEKLIMSLSEQFGIRDKLDLLPEELSVGQQQKVAIIRTLVKKPSIILADEPTGSVDDETAGEIISYLRSLNTEHNCTVIIATHGTFHENSDDIIIKLRDGYVEEN